MAIGDDLLADDGGLVGPLTFTPTMEEQGIRLATNDDDKNPPIFGGRGQPATFGDLQRQQRQEGFLGAPLPSAQRVRAGQSIITPEDVRPRNPFNPSEFQAPEDDALTPPGQLAPSEIGALGKALKNVEDILSTPGAAKFLSALGMQILPENTALGELGMEVAESNAQQQFRQGLESGQAAGDVLVPGLSAEGRESVLQSRRAERGLQVAESRESRLVEQEDRLQDLADLERQRLEQQVEAGRISNEEGALRLEAMQAAQGSRNTTEMVRSAMQTLGLNLGEGISLEGFTPEEGLSLVNKLASLEVVRRQMQGVGKDTATTVSMLSEAARRTRVETKQRQLAQLRSQLANPTATGTGRGLGDQSRRTILQQQNDIINEILELGGDPFAEVPGTGAVETGGGAVNENVPVGQVEIQNIMEATGLTQAQAESLTPEERISILRDLQNQ